MTADQEVSMVRRQTEGSQFGVETGPFLTATMLIGLGGLVAFIGFIIACLHALSQGSRLIRELETPPNELARSKINQLMAAATAGANAWKGFAQPDAGSAEGEPSSASNRRLSFQ
jgi:hypothetical protein